MKKLMTLLLSVMMVGCLGMTALAAEEEDQEMVPILAEVPDDWENPLPGPGQMMAQTHLRLGRARQWSSLAIRVGTTYTCQALFKM